MRAAQQFVVRFSFALQIGWLFAGAGLMGLGTIAERRERRAHGDAVKNITCLTNVPAPKGAEKEEFDV